MSEQCKFCRQGWNQEWGDIHCLAQLGGPAILMDIDVWMEGFPSNIIYPPAPCNPKRNKRTGDWKSRAKPDMPVAP